MDCGVVSFSSPEGATVSSQGRGLDEFRPFGARERTTPQSIALSH